MRDADCVRDGTGTYACAGRSGGSIRSTKDDGYVWHYGEPSKPAQASLRCGQVLLEKDNCLEDTHLKIMKCFMEIGLRDQAIRQYSICEEALNSLDLKPGKNIKSFFEKIILE